MTLPLFFAIFKAEIKIPYQRCRDLANFQDALRCGLGKSCIRGHTMFHCQHFAI